jgi:hypothetical protein
MGSMNMELAIYTYEMLILSKQNAELQYSGKSSFTDSSMNKLSNNKQK